MIPWSYGPSQFDAVGGENTLVALHVPHRGVLRNINLSTADGGAGTFEIYSSESAARRMVEEGDYSSSAGDSPLPPIASKVMNGTLSGGAYFANNIEIPYANQDGSPTNCIQRLWMRITPDGSSPKTFVLSMVIEMPRL